MIVRPASLTDIDTILDWRRQRSQWLAQRGETQWSVPWPRPAIAAAIQTGQTWMITEGDRPHASVTLTAWIDVDGLWKLDKDSGSLWHAEDNPTDALYVSKLMVPLEHAGNGLGGEILDWAGGRAYDAGLTWLRLDAWTTNDGLHHYYLTHGFGHVRTVPTRTSGWCAQRASQPYNGARLKTEH